MLCFLRAPAAPAGLLVVVDGVGRSSCAAEEIISDLLKCRCDGLFTALPLVFFAWNLWRGQLGIVVSRCEPAWIERRNQPGTIDRRRKQSFSGRERTARKALPLCSWTAPSGSRTHTKMNDGQSPRGSRPRCRNPNSSPLPGV